MTLWKIIKVWKITFYSFFFERSNRRPLKQLMAKGAAMLFDTVETAQMR